MGKRLCCLGLAADLYSTCRSFSATWSWAREASPQNRPVVLENGLRDGTGCVGDTEGMGPVSAEASPSLTTVSLPRDEAPGTAFPTWPQPFLKPLLSTLRAAFLMLQKTFLLPAWPGPGLGTSRHTLPPYLTTETNPNYSDNPLLQHHVTSLRCQAARLCPAPVHRPGEFLTAGAWEGLSRAGGEIKAAGAVGQGEGEETCPRDGALWGLGQNLL